MSLFWCLNNPYVGTVVLGAAKLNQLRENLSALDHKDGFTPELLQKIESIAQNKPVPVPLV